MWLLVTGSALCPCWRAVGTWCSPYGFDELFKAEARINDLYMEMAEDGADVDALMKKWENFKTVWKSWFLYLDIRLMKCACPCVMDFGMDTDVTSLSVDKNQGALANSSWKAWYLAFLSQPTTWMLSILISTLSPKTMKMHLSLFHDDIPFLNDVINIVYHVENQRWRVTLDYYQFQEVYAMKKSQLEAAYERQQKEIADLKDFGRNKSAWQHETWPCLVRRNWIRWILSSCKVRNQNHPLISNQLVHLGALSSSQGFANWLWSSSDHFKSYLERNQKVCYYRGKWYRETTLLKSLLGIIPPIAGEVERGDYLELGYFEQE